MRPRYIALGVTTLKIQGREYPAPLIAELTKIYRRLIDQTKHGQADVGTARAAIDPVLAARDECRMASTDWDPTAEEARLRSTEPTE